MTHPLWHRRQMWHPLFLDFEWAGGAIIAAPREASPFDSFDPFHRRTAVVFRSSRVETTIQRPRRATKRSNGDTP